ncbi:MAG: hypothetical protein RL574_1355 [Actinomycetota bacterium]
MCGIIAVLSRPETRSVPVAADLLAQIEAVVTQWPLTGAALPSDEALVVMGKQMTAVDASLRGDAGLWLLAGNREFVAALGTALEQLQGRISAAEDALESSGALDAAVLEKRAGLLTVLRDAVWSIRMDRLRTAAAVDGLAGAGASRSALAAYLSIQQVFSGLDRLEVRGRDSAGVHVMVWGHGVSPDDARVRAMLGARHDDNLFTSGSVRITREAWSFVYKAAAEIGELGDNTRVMRQAVVGDDLLRLLVSQQGARVAVLGHTRWASVGIISEPNAHPVNSEELESNADAAYLIAALNGDVDNHADLRARHELRLAQPITTDAKVIPALVSRRLAASTKDGSSTASTNGGGLTASADALADAFRETVASLKGQLPLQRHQPTTQNRCSWRSRAAVKVFALGWHRTDSSWRVSHMAWSKKRSTICEWMVNRSRMQITRRVVGKLSCLTRHGQAKPKEFDLLPTTAQHCRSAATTCSRPKLRLATLTAAPTVTFLPKKSLRHHVRSPRPCAAVLCNRVAHSLSRWMNHNCRSESSTNSRQALCSAFV